MLRYNFLSPNFIFPFTKNTHTSSINYFGPSQISPILPNLGPHKYFPYYYPTWAHTNTSHTITKIGSQNYTISITKLIITQHCLQSPCYTALYYKTRCYTIGLSTDPNQPIRLPKPARTKGPWAVPTLVFSRSPISNKNNGIIGSGFGF